MSEHLVVGFCGPARHGKDTASRSLHHFGFVNQAFAMPVKQIAALAFDEDVSLYSDDNAKIAPTPMYPEYTRRRVMQLIGTELFRGQWPDIWVNNWLSRVHKHERVVVTDVRFPNEVEAVRSCPNNIIIRIIDPRKPEPTDQHESEIHYKTIDADITIYNDASIDTLESKVLEYVFRRWTQLYYEVV